MSREEIVREVLASLALDNLYVSDEVIQKELNTNTRKKEKDNGSRTVE